MTVDQPVHTLRCVDRLAAIPADDWDRCAGSDNPFLAHAFLKSLEDSRSAEAPSGWRPQHLVAETRTGRIVGVAPLYLKSHSYGEYVFDHAWADAYRRAGGRYYPKLQVAVPFTPVPGPRLLVAPGAHPGVRTAMVQGLVEIADRLGVSSVHATFAGPDDHEPFTEAGFLTRVGFQFHWDNRGYDSFEAFLGDLASRKRKAIRKERGAAAAHGLVIHTLTGADIEERHWDAFFRVYMATSDRKWGQAYLTRAFFSLLGERMADQVVLILAEEPGSRRFVAGALNLLGRDTLYGRNWGCLGHWPFLHFELCYYRALDFAIARGLARVEAGAQGEHKLQRGYLPARTYSFHHLPDPAFRRAVADFLVRERAYVENAIAGLTEAGPFRQDLAEPEMGELSGPACRG